MACATSTDAIASTVELPREARSLRVILSTIEKLCSDSADDAGITNIYFGQLRHQRKLAMVVKVCMKEDLNTLVGGEPRGEVVNVL